MVRKRVARDTRARWSEIEDGDSREDGELLLNCVVRMAVYDAAPSDVRASARVRGDGPLSRWWNRLSFFERSAILDQAQADFCARGKGKLKWIGVDLAGDE